MPLKFDEAEIQALIALIELEQPVETPNNNFYRFHPRSLAEAAAYFKGFQLDWTPAYPRLAARGLLTPAAGAEAGWSLTAAGREAAAALRRARPPIYYWYREYYTLAPRSRAYARFCEALYGRALCQANFSDMDQLDALLTALELRPGQRALDLGCGVGLITEYLAEASGAAFTGIDYCPEAIAQALERTTARRFGAPTGARRFGAPTGARRFGAPTGAYRDRLDFAVQNLDSLDFPERSFDALVSIDTLYMPNDLDATLRKMAALLKPGGRMAIFYSSAIWDAGGDRARLAAERTPLGEALARVGLPYQAQDFSAAAHRHLQRKHRIGISLRPEFEAEGSLGLYEYILAESDPGEEPFDPQTCAVKRYLYKVKLAA